MASRGTKTHNKNFARNNTRRDLALREPYAGARSRALTLPGPVISLRTYLPRSVAQRARRKTYPYPHPVQRSRAGRTIRQKLRTRRDLVPVIVRVRLPTRLATARPSYVSINRGRLNIHSRKQLRALMARGELNRRRYAEGKGNKRKARNGQLDSPGATTFGSVAEGTRRGATIGQLADMALAARAVSKNRS